MLRLLEAKKWSECRALWFSYQALNLFIHWAEFSNVGFLRTTDCYELSLVALYCYNQKRTYSFSVPSYVLQILLSHLHVVLCKYLPIRLSKWEYCYCQSEFNYSIPDYLVTHCIFKFKRHIWSGRSHLFFGHFARKKPDFCASSFLTPVSVLRKWLTNTPDSTLCLTSTHEFAIF